MILGSSPPYKTLLQAQNWVPLCHDLKQKKHVPELFQIIRPGQIYTIHGPSSHQGRHKRDVNKWDLVSFQEWCFCLERVSNSLKIKSDVFWASITRVGGVFGTQSRRPGLWTRTLSARVVIEVVNNRLRLYIYWPRGCEAYSGHDWWSHARSFSHPSPWLLDQDSEDLDIEFTIFSWLLSWYSTSVALG